MSKLLEKLKKTSTIKDTAILTKSRIWNEKDMVQTSVPMINVALSGSVDGGLTPGVTILAGPSKHFKSAFALIMAAAYQKKYPDGVVLFYDSEFGTPQTYFDTFGIDKERVIHTPITDAEMLKIDIMNQLNAIERGERICIVIDSVGNLASKKEVEDALDGKSVADMTRAKAFKSLFRMITPHLTLKDVPLIAIAHTYNTIEMYSKPVVSGGTGITYSADNIWIIGRQQEKDGDELAGWRFIINIEKSRFVKEKSKIPIVVLSKDGISKWSGMFDVAVAGGYIVSPSKGYYAIKGQEEKKFRAKEIVDSDQFWERMLKETDLKEYIKNKYSIGCSVLGAEDEEEGEE